jgi:hypothetical protein
MFKKFGLDIPQSLVDAVSNIMEAKDDEPAKPDADAIARRKRLQALKDKQEDDAAEHGYAKEKSNVRKVAGKAYGGAKQKDEPEQQDEEVVNELSKGMLATYIRRASDPSHPKSNVNLASRAADKLAKGGKDDGEEDDRKAYKRSRNIGLAAAKMAREEVEQVDEGHHMHTHTVHFAEPESGEWKGKVLINVDNDKDAISTGHDMAKKNGFKLMKVSKNNSIMLDRTMHEEIIFERTLTTGETKKKEHIVKSMKKNVGGFKKRYGEKAKSVMYATATKMAKNEEDSSELMKKRQSQYNQAEAVELHLDLTEGDKQGMDLPFTPDKPHGKIAVAGKQGYGVSASRHLARMGLKKITDKQSKEKLETVMGKDGCTSEETVKESRGHKILATKLRQLSMKSHGMAPEMSVNAQDIKDKLKDADNVKGVEIVKQKDTSIKEEGEKWIQKAIKKPGALHKQLGVPAGEKIPEKKLKKAEKAGGKLGKRARLAQTLKGMHKEEVQIDETAALDQYIKSMGYDPKNMDKNKKVMFSKTNAFKQWASRQEESLYDGGQKGTQDIDVHTSQGATARG